jgi:hypothetical protein
MISPEWKTFWERVFTPKKKGIIPTVPWGILVFWVTVVLMLNVSAVAGWAWDTFHELPTYFRGSSGFEKMLSVLFEVDFAAVVGCALGAALTIFKEHREEFLSLIKNSWRHWRED